MQEKKETLIQLLSFPSFRAFECSGLRSCCIHKAHLLDSYATGPWVFALQCIHLPQLKWEHPILRILEYVFIYLFIYFFLQTGPFDILVTLSDTIYFILRRILIHGQMQTNLWLEYFFGYDSQVNPGIILWHKITGVNSSYFVFILWKKWRKWNVHYVCLLNGKVGMLE